MRKKDHNLISFKMAVFFLAFLLVSITVILGLKLYNAHAANKSIGANFFVVITGFSLDFAEFKYWSVQWVDVLLNLLIVISWPILASLAILSYVIYYLELGYKAKYMQQQDMMHKQNNEMSEEKMSCDTMECEEKMSCSGMMCEEKSFEQMMTDEKPCDEMECNKQSDSQEQIVEEKMMADTHAEVMQPVEMKEKPKARKTKKPSTLKNEVSELPAPAVKKTKKIKPKKHIVGKEILLKNLYLSPELSNMTKTDIKKIFEKIVEVVDITLHEKQEVTIQKFGRFEIVQREERHTTNPLTREPIVIPARKVIKFKVSKAIKERLNK